MTEQQLRAVLLLAGAGSVLVLVNLFGLAGSLVGLGLMAAGVLLASRARGQRGLADVDWWRLLAGGTVLVAAGIALGVLLETPGGLLAAVGGAIGVASIALALP